MRSKSKCGSWPKTRLRSGSERLDRVYSSKLNTPAAGVQLRRRSRVQDNTEQDTFPRRNLTGRTWKRNKTLPGFGVPKSCSIERGSKNVEKTTLRGLAPTGATNAAYVYSTDIVCFG